MLKVPFNYEWAEGFHDDPIFKNWRTRIGLWKEYFSYYEDQKWKYTKDIIRLTFYIK